MIRHAITPTDDLRFQRHVAATMTLFHRRCRLPFTILFMMLFAAAIFH